MKKLTLESLDGLMSASILKKIDDDYPFYPLASYLNGLRNKVWGVHNQPNYNDLQKTFEEKYIFNLIAILNCKTTSNNKIINVVTNELKAVMEIIVERIFSDQQEHYSYLLSVIDNIKHPKLNETIILE